MSKKSGESVVAIIVALCLLVGTAQAQNSPRLVILGFDGADPQLIDQLLAQGKLPHLAKLAKQGSFQRLQTTNPAHSPVAWASFATGNNPGKHRIFGFLRRGKDDYRPEFALARIDKRNIFPWQYRILLSWLVALLLLVSVWLLTRKTSKIWLCKPTLVLALIIGGGLHYSLLTFIPQTVPFPISWKAGKSLWTLSAEQKISTKVLFAPIAFPAEKVPGGQLLSGFGVPDIAGTNGMWFRHSSRYSKLVSSETGGWRAPLHKKSSHSYQGQLIGPKNLLVQEKYQKLKQALAGASFSKGKFIRNQMSQLKENLYLQQNFTVEVSPEQKQLVLQIQDHKVKLQQGQWSPWLGVSFSLSPFLSLEGMFRCRVIEVADQVELYFTPIQFHPQSLPSNVALSYPGEYASELFSEVTSFPTLGWAVATNALKDELIEEQIFWEDLNNTVSAREQVYSHALNQKDWQLLVTTFYFTDRAGHMYWRFIDPEHPLHQQAHEKYPSYRDNLTKVYQKMDAIIGKTLQKLSKNDKLLVVSDHGFASFRWEVNINTWLWQQGYLHLKDKKNQERMQVRDLFERERLLSHLDWSKTQAYSIGLGKIFINLKGRDRQGVVSREQYSKLCHEIARKLEKLTHQNQQVVKKVYLKNEVFHGPYTSETADLLLGFARGYRVSWQTSLGGLGTEVMEPNLLKWSGDHCSVAPDLVPGIFFSNAPVSTSAPHIQDIAPSVLHFFNKEAARMDGEVFEFRK